MRTLGGRRLVAPAALAALLAAVLVVPGTATADESDGTYELVVANISTADAQANAAWVGQRIATASVSPTTWSAGDTVTVTVTYEHADDAPL